MKEQHEPITEDEWLIRLVWKTRLTDKILPSAFDPLPSDSDGLSLFRRACLNDPADALLVIAEEKRSSYAIVQVPVKLLTDLGLSVRPDAIDAVAGHVVVPEINITDFKADKFRLMSIKEKLAGTANANILRRPTHPDAP